MSRIKIVFTFALILYCFENSIKAQFYIGVHTGYASPLYYCNDTRKKISDLEYASKYTTYCKNSTTIIRKNNKVNVGNGLFYSFELGYKINKRFSISLNGFYLNNNKYSLFYNKPSNEYQYVSNINTYAENNYVLSYFGKRASLTPCFIGSVQKKNCSLEFSLGVTASKLTIYRNIEMHHFLLYPWDYDKNRRDYYKSTKEYYTQKIQYRPSVSLRILKNINARLAINASVEWYPFQTIYIYHGKQYYSKEYSTEDNVVLLSTEDTNEYDVQLNGAISVNFNTLNLGIGIRYFITKKK